MHSDLKKFLTYNKSERRGIFFLLLMIIVVIIINLSLPSLVRNEGGNKVELIAMYDSIMQLRIIQDSLAYSQNIDTAISYFTFDPNGLPPEKWELLGLTQKQIRVIKNYENAGGKFYRKEDLKKIYSISDELYEKLKPYIKIPQRKSKKKEKKISYSDSSQRSQNFLVNKEVSSKNKDSSYILELNNASSDELETLYGIGPVFADRIIKYRDLLGGFHTKEQLLEVYGFDSARYRQIENAVVTDSIKVRRLRINLDEFRDILRHPYFSYELTREIFNYRSKGRIKRLESIRQLNSINDSIFKK
ncbi:MAG: helix-hairpin-helix domain-containing protein [Bacteroidota bacterium]|nr:helix-hairpin-helix domain-containing protein [Bacteroidota bacterium]